MKLYGSEVPLTVLLLRPLSHEKNNTNDISFESPNIGLLEFIQKLGVASFWRWPAHLTKKAPLSLKLI